MMFRNVKILTWLVVILLVTNLTTVVAVWYNTREYQAAQTGKAIEVPGDKRTRFFKEQLELRDDQLDAFREANRNFNRQARAITDAMSDVRARILQELFADSVNHSELERLSVKIGEEHERLKLLTCNFYLDLKSLCDDEQRVKLSAIFQSLLDTDDKVKLPEKQHRLDAGE